MSNDKITTFPILQPINTASDGSVFSPSGIAGGRNNTGNTGMSSSFTGDLYSSRARFGNGQNFWIIDATEMRTNNFVAGSAGCRISYDGDVEFNDGNFRGDITGATGTFSGTVNVGSLNIPDSTTANSFHTDALGNSWWGCNVADFTADNNNAKAYILKTGAAKFETIFSVGGGGKLLEWDNTDITLLGGIITGGTIQTATSGKRIILSGTSNALAVINAAGTEVATIQGAVDATILDLNGAFTDYAARIQSTATNSSVDLVALTGYGTQYLLSLTGASNASRTKALFNITPTSGQGAHLNLTPIASAPQTPSEGDIYADTDHSLYYHNATEFKPFVLGTPTYVARKEVTMESAATITNTATTRGGSMFMYSATSAIFVWTDVTNTDVYFTKTVNSGTTWSAKAKINDGSVEGTDRAIYTPDGTTIYVVTIVGTAVKLSKSTNSGTDWTDSTIDDTAAEGTELRSGAAIAGNGSNLFVVWYESNTAAGGGTKVNFIKSTDGGVNWTGKVTIDTYTNTNYNVGYISLSRIDDNNLWACWLGAGGNASSSTLLIFSTANGGANWTEHNAGGFNGTSTRTCSIWAVSATEVYATYMPSGGVDLLKSTGGDFSKVDDVSNTLSFASVYAPEHNVVYVGGLNDVFDFYLSKYEDGGITEASKLVQADTKCEGCSLHGISRSQMCFGWSRDSDQDVKVHFGKELTVAYLPNGTGTGNPAVPPAVGTYLYSKSGELYAMDSAGNVSAALS